MLAHTQQLKQGKRYEDFLDGYFEPEWLIAPMPEYWERKYFFGDRIFVRRSDYKQVQFIEYKSDESASRTGNLFIETVSVDSTVPPKPGWAVTCQANFIFYYLPLDSKILIFRPNVLRDNLESWRHRYREVPTAPGKNSGYQTWGILLPVEIAETYAVKIISTKGACNE